MAIFLVIIAVNVVYHMVYPFIWATFFVYQTAWICGGIIPR